MASAIVTASSRRSAYANTQFGSLSNDLLVEIIDLLPIADISSLCMVCRSLCALLLERVVWHRHLSRLIQRRRLYISHSHVSRMSTEGIKAEIQRQARLDLRWQHGKALPGSMRYTTISGWPLGLSMIPGGRYLLTAMRNLSVLLWDLEADLDEPEVLIPRGGLLHKTLVTYEADSWATREQLRFILQTADGMVDFWSLDISGASETRCTHMGAVQLRAMAQYTRLRGDIFSGYLADTGCVIFFNWKSLVMGSESVKYSSLHLPRECRDVCQLSTGQVLVVDSQGVALYPPPPCYNVTNILEAKYDTTVTPTWYLKQEMLDCKYRIVPSPQLGSIASIISEKSLVDLILIEDGSMAASTTIFDAPDVLDTFVGGCRVATARAADGVTDAWYLRCYSISGCGPSLSPPGSRMIAHPEVQLPYPGGIITHRRPGALRFRLDELSGRAVTFVRANGGKSHFLVFDFV
ncbi:hypothetical protein FRB93_013980 [Tulasnella sp. JGI-2019a]|nr:hypothetical protein FRB93_013980 [Tulasnella sp. JGI-2019a]